MKSSIACINAHIPQVCALLFSLWTACAASASSPSDARLFSGLQVGLVKQAHDAGMRYLNLQNAIEDGYVPATGCVSGDAGGAMGVHYVKPALLGDGRVDPALPEALVYEPGRYGGLNLVAVEYMVFSAAWHASHDTPPVVTGQAMDLMGEPNRYAIPAVYELHVWAFRDNPNGMFASFNPRVTCENYDPPAAP